MDPATIGAIILAAIGLVSSIIGIFVKMGDDKAKADAEAAKKRAEQEKVANDTRQQVANDTRDQNASIDKQTQAGRDWVKNNPILPEKK